MLWVIFLSSLNHSVLPKVFTEDLCYYHNKKKAIKQFLFSDFQKKFRHLVIESRAFVSWATVALLATSP